MPKKQTKKKNGHVVTAINIRLPPMVAKRLKNGIDALVDRFEKGLTTLKPTLNQLVVDAVSRQLDILDAQLKAKRSK